MSARTAILGGLAFLVCLVGFVWVAWLVSQPGIPPIDSATTAFLHGLANPTLDALMNAATFLGSSPVLAVFVGLAVVLLVSRGRRVEAAFLVVALVGSLVLDDWLKALVQRPRPGFDWAEIWPETSFPSGHSMDSFVVYLSIALLVWRLGGRRVGSVALVLAIVAGGQRRHQPDLPGSPLVVRRHRWLPGRGAVAAAPGRCVGPCLTPAQRESPRRPARGWGSAARAVPTRSVTLMGPGRRP